jgi:hypothetical protein
MTENADFTPEIVSNPDDPIVRAVASMDLGAREKRHLAFLLLVLADDCSPAEAAERIGMHRSSGSRLLKDLNERKEGRGLMAKFIEKTQNQFRAKTALKLDRLATIETKVLDMLEAQPEMASKFPQLMRQIKTVAGVLQDAAPSQPTISIASVANLMLNTSNMAPMTIEDSKEDEIPPALRIE